MVLDLVDVGAVPEWHSCVEYIREHCKGDELYANYLNINLAEFVSFPVVIEDGQIVAFSGAQYRPMRWSPFVARISTRMWIHPDRRETHLTHFTPGARVWYNSELIIPRQLEVIARTKTIQAVFITRHRHPRGFQKFIDLVNLHNHMHLKVFKHPYYVCGRGYMNEDCLQYVAAAEVRDCNLKKVIEGALIDPAS